VGPSTDRYPKCREVSVGTTKPFLLLPVISPFTSFRVIQWENLKFSP
jgi:hypothetical protein